MTRNLGPLVTASCFAYAVESLRRIGPARSPGRGGLFSVSFGYVPSLHHLRQEYVPFASTLTETDPFLLTRTDPASAQGCARKGVKGTWNKCGGGMPRLCRESPLTPWRADTLMAAPGMGFCHPRRLPHGECGVWGSAPGSAKGVLPRATSTERSCAGISTRSWGAAALAALACVAKGR